MRFLWLLIVPFFACASNIVVVTMAIGEDYQELVESGIRNKRDYCKKQGYDFVYENRQLDLSRPIPWTKIPLILDTMEKTDAEWIFWSDADSVVMNPAFRLEEFIDEEYDIIGSSDPGPPINTGQFFIRNCPWSRDFLKKVYSHTECIHHHWWENQAFIVEMETNPDLQKKLKIVPQRLFNSYPYNLGIKVRYQKGDFIIHFPSYRGDALKNAMEEYASKVAEEELTLKRHLSCYGITKIKKSPPINLAEGACQLALRGVEQLDRLEEVMREHPALRVTVKGEKRLPIVEFFQRKYPDRFTFIKTLP